MQWVAAAVEEKGEATQEIARNVKMATSITHEVTTNVTEVTMAAQQTGASEMARQSTKLWTEVDTFLSDIKVA